ncbi:hypothetical protein OC842_007584, partial [Tilletia horrida]
CRPRAFVPESQRDLFITALKNDLAFLTESNVMDYSLLVGMYEPDVSSAELSRDMALAEAGRAAGSEEGDVEDDEGEEREEEEEEEEGGEEGQSEFGEGEEDNELGPKVRVNGGAGRRRSRQTAGTAAKQGRCRQPMIRARIVDYIGAFTLAKQLESSSKKALKSGPEAKSNVTILPPSEYAERFGAAMLAAFTGCPDRTGPADLAAAATMASAATSSVRGGGGGAAAAAAHLPSVL